MPRRFNLETAVGHGAECVMDGARQDANRREIEHLPSQIHFDVGNAVSAHPERAMRRVAAHRAGEH